MAVALAEHLAAAVHRSRDLYHRLVLVVGPHQSGKTAALRALHAQRGWPLLNMNLELSTRLLELTVKQRALRTAAIVADVVEGAAGDVVQIDNIEMLFHPALAQDPLRLLQSLSRNRTIVATWRGEYVDQSLTYATLDHPEFRRFDAPQALIVSAGVQARTGSVTSPQEHSA